jgi:putative acetyltransferase
MTTQSLIRPFHSDDVEAYYTIVSDPATLETYLGVPVLEIGSAQEWAKQALPGLHRLVVECDGTAVGFGALQQIQRPRRVHSGEIEWIMQPKYRTEEYSKQLLTALVDLADRWLNLRRVEVQLIARDDLGIQLVEQLGFEREGTYRMAVFGKGRFHDVQVYSRLRDYAPPEIVEIPRPPHSQNSPVAITIRPVRPEDAAGLHNLFRDPAVARTTNQLPSQEYTTVAERTAQHRPHLYRLVAEVDGRVVGNINLSQSDNPRMVHSAWFGMAVHPDYWGLRVGNRLLEAMLDLADNWLNLRRVALEVHPDNAAAIHLYQKFGFEMEGKRRMYSYGDGRWADAYFMARL